MAAIGFQLVTSLKMETEWLRFKLERLSVLMETELRMNVGVLLKMLTLIRVNFTFST